ncbi:hypothetical protein PCH_Pc22g21520 [Penicillium rubens Wisconsin 54-1255]|uniref:Uncharacterized protein n=1 Tax=Penicillium rubens (strain ATCC 28089 / DSM 1075 / NRRL 1951 / Wisconsin 54-1255) TaxID=500485 RepID=B6HSW5_PENRW|nr:hypothetical protein PCH_Pc22g21520 [Penicillium rubens Wisconsin 54-1255]
MGATPTFEGFGRWPGPVFLIRVVHPNFGHLPLSTDGYVPGYGGVIGPSGLRANVYVFDVSYLRCHSISNTLEVCKVRALSLKARAFHQPEEGPIRGFDWKNSGQGVFLALACS